jgi:hypothetical protein
MTIIEVDGVNHQPLVVDSLQIFAGTKDPTQIQMVLTCENRTAVLGCGKDLLLINVVENNTYCQPGFQLNANQRIGNYCNFGILELYTSSELTVVSHRDPRCAQFRKPEFHRLGQLSRSSLCRGS